MENIYPPFYPILSHDAMRQLDASLVQANRGWTLMQIAAQGLTEAIIQILRKGCLERPTQHRPAPIRKLPAGWNTRPVLVLAGKGNNGGDGILTALKLLQQKIPCTLVLLYPQEQYKNEAALALKAFVEAGNKVVTIKEDQIDSLKLNEFGLVVDALFGRGFKGDLQGIELALQTKLLAQGSPVFSVDLPSGAVGNSAKAIKADWTLILGVPDLEACVEAPGDLYGQWKVHTLGLPLELYKKHQEGGRVYWISDKEVAQMLPERSAWKDKRSQGVLGVLAGSRGMIGAAILCSEAAMRSGAGLVHLAAPTGEMAGMAAQLTEVVLHPQDSVNGALQASAQAGAISLFSRCDATCIGPGLSTLSEVQKLVRQMCLELSCPLVIDADGINAFRGYAAMLRGIKEMAILTPHETEWERLFKSKPGMGQDRIVQLQENCKEYGCVIVLKGAPTMIGTPEGDVFVLPTANSAMAKAGSGDVLAGIIASLRAQGANAIMASIIGVWVHARAGYVMAGLKGARGTLPSDLIEKLPEIFMELEQL